MLYLTCTTITSVDLAYYGVSRAKDWVSVYCGTILYIVIILYLQPKTPKTICIVSFSMSSKPTSIVIISRYLLEIFGRHVIKFNIYRC